jgi:uncharacterized membrane protein
MIDSKRIYSIDATRGLVMVIMALDHVRDFMHTTSMTQSPTDMKTTTVILFMTRWITHLCAPTFVFLSGLSAYIANKRSSGIPESRRFLITRGIWLVILELTIINFALWFDIHFRLEILEVISAIGFSFIILGLILKLPSRVIGIAGLIIIFGHNLLQGVSLPSNSAVSFIFSFLFRPSLFQITPGMAIYTGYPVIPWLGIMLIGFACGELFDIPEEKRSKLLLRAGLSVLVLFVLIRFINIYGDPAPWAKQKSAVFTFLSFINTTKYPPSLLFTLMILGITFLLLFITEKVKNKFTGILSVYGKVPLFYFTIHLYIIHSLMLAMLFLQGFKGKDFIFGVFNNGRPKTGSGVNLAVIYLIWLGVVIILYPVCKWYGKYKSEHRENKFLRYL